jgi:isopentenyl phosphate kinase
MMKVILKLGGSIITRKGSNEFPADINKIKEIADNYINFSVIERIAREIKSIKNLDLILINGAGPFGHYLVNEYLKNQKITMEDVHESVKILNEKLIQTFKSQGLKLVPIEPFTTCHYDENFNITNLWKKAEKILPHAIPSTYGDIIKSKIKTKLGYYKIISGDDLAVELAKLWKPDLVLMATDVDGIYSKNPKFYADAELISRLTAEDIMKIEFRKDTIDVTGSMEAKVKKLLSLAKFGVKSRIINGLKKENIKKALVGEEIGTLIC